MSDDEVACAKHGKFIGAVVCRHHVTIKDRAVGFVENSSGLDDPQAWCDDCEALFLREQELTEAFQQFCDFAVVCPGCYEDLKQLHSRA
jgi:hypothetical protein